ncbi:MAG: type II secretion system F family protein [Planctomycetes bacterium]|nr:type II secretion system F family protein [Planctomycetota bacterium]
MHYEYEAKTTTGENLAGFLTASSLQEARQLLREKKLFVVSMKAAGDRRGLGRARKSRFGDRVSKKDLMALTSQLAVMSRAGVDLATALEDVGQHCPNPAVKKILGQIHEDVLSGKPISVAMRNFEHVFGKSYVGVVAAAEAAGRLPEVLGRLAALLRSDLRMRSTLRTLLAYPVLLASVSALVVLALMFFVLPQFAKVFDQLEVPLPVITQVLIGISTELRSRFWLWGGLVLVGIPCAIAFLKSDRGRRQIDGLLLRAALVRDVTRPLLIGRTFRLLGTMLESGVPLLEGLRLTRSSISNSVLREFFQEIEREVVNGRGLGDSLLNCPYVPPAGAQMVATAERTGTLAAVTQLTGEFFEEEGETRLRDLATVLEPLIIIVMGVIVAFVVMSVMLPVFDFATITR